MKHTFLYFSLFRSYSFLSLSFPAFYFPFLLLFIFPPVFLSISSTFSFSFCFFLCLSSDFLCLSSLLKISCAVSLAKNYRSQGAKSTDRAILRRPPKACNSGRCCMEIWFVATTRTIVNYQKQQLNINCRTLKRCVILIVCRLGKLMRLKVLANHKRNRNSYTIAR